MKRREVYSIYNTLTGWIRCRKIGSNFLKELGTRYFSFVAICAYSRSLLQKAFEHSPITNANDIGSVHDEGDQNQYSEVPWSHMQQWSFLYDYLSSNSNLKIEKTEICGNKADGSYFQ